MTRILLVLIGLLFAGIAAAQSGPPASQAVLSYTALKAVSETYSSPAITSGTLTIDLSAGTVFNVTNNADITTFTIANAASGQASAFTLFLKGDGTTPGHAQTWPTNVKWPSGLAPTLTTTNGKVDVLTFVSNDGGTTWFGFVAGQNY